MLKKIKTSTRNLKILELIAGNQLKKSSVLSTVRMDASRSPVCDQLLQNTVCKKIAFYPKDCRSCLSKSHAVGNKKMFKPLQLLEA